MGFWDSVKHYAPELIGAATGTAIAGPLGGLAGAAIGYGGQKIAGSVSGAYDQKKQGFKAVQDKAAEMEQQRLQRLQDVYGQADAKYDNSRAAMKALYGDPSTWKL